MFQSILKLEQIFIDGGSIDNTKQIIINSSKNLNSNIFMICL